ncbi:MAG: zf-HC2 domain-containing protein [Candidatus Omnitrophota bacterium]|nr:MAG: zf-HC2 domain-containing protein [Candidatus Omnitrophota bacterium]
MQKTSLCLPETELNDYLSGMLSPEKKAEIENHLKDCNGCLEKLVFAYGAVEEFNKTKKGPHSGGQGVKLMKSMWKKNLWLFGAIIAFILSFFVPRYFIQFLVATILMGAKWIFESINARILIMIYDAWKKGGEKEATKILKTLNDRINL